MSVCIAALLFFRWQILEYVHADGKDREGEAMRRPDDW